MNAYQPKVPASRAALIYLLESVFSSLISVATGFDEPTWPLFLGGGLILLGNLLVEIPNLRRKPAVLPGSRAASLWPPRELHRISTKTRQA
jgi:drug/metabolite transporter (DMT)-like permease